jgi:hypothetical protein
MESGFFLQESATGPDIFQVISLNIYFNTIFSSMLNPFRFSLHCRISKQNFFMDFSCLLCVLHVPQVGFFIAKNNNKEIT